MFGAANQATVVLDIQGFQHDLHVLELTGKEAISQPFRFDLELVSERADLDLESLLHRMAFLSLDRDGHGVHGQIYSVAQGDSSKRLTRYRLSLVPSLAYLDHCFDHKIFQKRSVPQIIADVLEAHGILGDAYRFTLGMDYRPRDYCVQHGESSLHFLQRLCEEEGLHYHFQHSRDGHVLVFGDDQTVFPRLARPTAYKQARAMVAEAPVINTFTLALDTRTTAVTRRDYDFKKPLLSLESGAKSASMPTLEDYGFPGHFTDRERGKHLSKRALERHRSDYRQATGDSDQPMLVSGHFLSLTNHPRQPWNDLWLLTEVRHTAKQPQVLEAEAISPADDEFPQGYRNTFLATPWDTPFRPALNHPKPTINGYQHAVVCGPPGEEIHCDEYGRVRIQFPWDRDGQYNDHSSCWVRVAGGWAHDRYGSVLTPRVGMEVIIGFYQGDPDEPMIVGCLANGANQPPLDLPADKTRSLFKTRSSPGGDGYNELRIEDRKGAEEISVRAQRNYLRHVVNDEQVQVNNQRSIVVGGDARHEFHAEEQHITHGNRLTELRQNDHLSVHGDRHVSVTTQRLTARQQIHIAAGQNMVIDGGASATLQAGGAWITLTSAGIFSSVPMQIGGQPLPLMAAAPVSLDGSKPPHTDPVDVVLLKRLQGDEALIELCQKPSGGTPMDCPLSDCPCRKALRERS
ncbi:MULTISPECIES: type VI secretion system tip protein VgrG [unclassified Pseudomonas]|uniref:type VI secretion system Vgr family protein n=1 Tax=unclassified Pseudomonas TaxID=196821 RepID=UPI002AC95B88|nr:MULTISPECIES: type VI secretion system tip protein VgrG [unclassified Pseudomonas]MEB0047702.1 type VI secretion system tip protein VgrG [Pseudomonas sp. Dout3]MEB0094612.1 type VI secretion system tip protein VgrG [Pseudomonas sp. DC1.2]WPX60017.1 type VI secretion system tip protein VgrG [Pseudomonas sp. DC1.2]